MGSHYKVCMCFTLKFREAEAQPPQDVKDAFNKYADGATRMTAEQLRSFLVEAQRETEEEADAMVPQILHKHHHHHLHLANFTRHSLTLQDFHHYLFSADLNPPIITKVHQDMIAPLSHFFIFTGHNSYLTGNQLTSKCSEAPIIRALKKGVRVIELDLWPNSSNNDVNVLHGRTATSPVSLIKCLKSIKENAFLASDYPVIITLEDHLTCKLQAKVAKMLSQVFGKKLFIPESDCLQEFPSPQELKHRVIISTKPPKEYLEVQSPNGSESMKRKDSDEWGLEPSSLTAEQDDEDEMTDPNPNEDEECEAEAPQYRRLIAIHAGKPKGGMKEELRAEADRVRRLSVSEQALEKAAETLGTDIVRFTHKNLLRVYPKGTRFTSSNYKPQVGWLHGAQMIAFNMQGYGRSLWLMQGMFRANGGCGYVKKPDILMNSNVVFDPKGKPSIKKTLTVKVYMGDGWHLDFKKTHFDAYSPPDFYVRVGIAGAPADEVMRRTKTVINDWSPVWEEEFTFRFTVPELALLRIEVHEYDVTKDDFAGQTCLPVSELRPGLRAVALCDRKGEKLNSTRLLMRFDISAV